MEENQEQKHVDEKRGERAEQHAVTPVSKFVTELPFFYLTKQKRLLQQDIRYEGHDAYGNPIRWEIIPNRSSRIGVPAIEAHTIFTRLVKPVMEMHRTPDGQVPEILPLGGIRECLRAIGWSAGGWEARRFLQGLMQIGQATCDFDFLLPSGESDAEGKPLFKTIKGIFTRFAIWKIGGIHISEEELATGNFNFEFNLADTVYIQLNKVERDMQRSQDHRYLDNDYMFSVEARARRWYELNAAKVFGVVKNNGKFFEVRYSWYIKHHHTLLRCNTRAKAVTQMNRIVKDHINSGFLKKVEYRTIKDEHGLLDLEMRCFPGPTAQVSTERVLAFLNTSTFPLLVARRRNRKRKVIQRSETNLQEPSVAMQNANAEPITIAQHELSAVASDLLTKLIDRGVVRSAAVSIVKSGSDEDLRRIDDWIEYWDSLRQEKTAGLLVHLIHRGDPLPISFVTRRHKEERMAAEQERKRLAELEMALEQKFQKFARRAVDEFVAPKIASGEFERRVEECKTGMLSEFDFWRARPHMAEELARHQVRAEIAKGANVLTYEEFRRLELSSGQSASETGGESTQASTANSPQNALNEPSPHEVPQQSGFSTSEQSDSPGGV